MPYVRLRVSDSSLLPWLMVFKRRLLAIYESGVRAFHRTEITDLFNVELRIQGDQLYVSLVGTGGMYFEFQTSGMPVTTQTDSGFEIYEAAIIGVTVNAEDGLFPHAVMQGGQKTTTGDNVDPLRRPLQIQLLDEPVSYPGPIVGRFGYPRTLYEAYAPHHPHTGVFTRAYPMQWLPFYYSTVGGSFQAHGPRDILYDIPFMDGNKKENVERAYIVNATADWPRSTGIQVVKHILWGNREFGISVDAFDQVSVFPTSQIGPVTGTFFAPGQNVPSLYVQTQRVSFPAWVYAKTQRLLDWYAAHPGATDIGTTEFPEYDWKLHPDGLEMCSVVYERYQCDLNTMFFNTYATPTGVQGPATYWPDATSFYKLTSNASGFGPPIEDVPPSVPGDKWYLNGTGILRVVIDIQLTGPRPEDYTLTLTTEEIRRPTTTPYCTFLAGYVWHDIKASDYAPDNKVYAARRGDMMTLDLELYGHPTSGATANLCSLKNLSDSGKEINVIAAGTTFTGAPLAKFALLTYDCDIVAADLKTLSFVVRDACEEFVARNATIHFGMTVYVMNKYADTLFPDLVPPPIRDIITANGQIDQRAVMDSTFPGITLMPLNDMRDWTDPDLASLRENYSRMFSSDTYAAGTDPLENWNQMETFGQLYWKTGARDFPLPSTAATVWYNSLMAQGGLRPFGMFYLIEPRPGWFLYTAQMMQRIVMAATATFFSHPNGTWAYFDKQWLYNANGYLPIVTLGGSHSGIGDLDPAGLEHCVFDKVHFQLDRGGVTFTRDSNFVELYNLAIQRAKKNKTLADDSEEIDPTYKDIKGVFTVGTVADTFDPTVSYAKLLMNWYPKVTPGGHYYFVDRAYYSGTKDFFIGFEFAMMGHLANFCFGAIMYRVSDDSAVSPLFDSFGITFSSCVAITT